MKIVRLEQDRIKVILSDSELMNMNIDIETLIPDSPELSTFLCEVMEAVKEETGFSAETGQVVVEATVSGGGIVLILSKKAKNRIKGVRAVRKNENVVFEFNGFNDLSGFLLNINTAYLWDMRLYRYLNKFYIAVNRQRIPIIIYEYSMHNRRLSVAENMLSEYGTAVAGGKELIKLVSELKKIE